MKIALVLRALLSDLRETDKHRKPLPGDAQVLRIAESELRALVGVARAARKAIPVLNNGAAGLAEAGYEGTSIEVRAESDRLDRALDRLERAGLEKP